MIPEMKKFERICLIISFVLKFLSGSFFVSASAIMPADNMGINPIVKIEQISPTVFFRKAGTGLEQGADLKIYSSKELNNILLKIDYNDKTFTLIINDIQIGQQEKRIYLPDIRDTVNINFSLIYAGKKMDEKAMQWLPGKHWQVYLVHGSHHDLGYTGLPDMILEEHKGYIEKILDYCELTKNWPEESRFHYVFEEGWSLLYFMEHASEPLRNKLIHFLLNGQLELTALFANQTTDICGIEELNRLVYPSFDIKRKYKVPVQSAELNDIPGINWGLVSVLAGCGIKYLNAGIQDYFAWGEKVPVPWDEKLVMKRNCAGAFYWEGPDKSKVLFWYGSGKIESVWLWDLHFAENELNNFLMQQQQEGYGYDLILTKVLGGLRDNSLPDIRLCGIVKAWNEKWEYPKIKFTTNTVFFKDFEKKAGAGLRTLRGDFTQTDYNIGALSTPKETGVNRINHDLLTTAEKFSAVASSITGYSYPSDQIASAYERMMLYDEHCWGMAQPAGPAQEAAESQKGSHAWQSAAQTQDIVVKSLNKIADQVNLINEGIHIVVFNPLSFTRTDVVQVQANPLVPAGKPFYKEQRKMEDGHIYYVNRSGEASDRKQVAIPASFLAKPFQILDISSGKIIDYQLSTIDDPLLPVPYASARYALSQAGRKSPDSLNIDNNNATDLYFVAEDVPPMGYKVYQMVPVKIANEVSSSATVTGNVIENSFYKIQYNEYKGITSILDKLQNKELMNCDEKFSMGQVLIKPVQSPDVTYPDLFEVTIKDNGPVFTSLYLKRKSNLCPVINQEVTIFHHVKKIDFATRIFKTPAPFYEIYLGFPLLIETPRFRIESVNSVIEPIADQLPGTTTDYYSIQHGLSAFNDKTTISWSSIEAPVVKISELWPDYLSQAHHAVKPFNAVHTFAEKFKKGNIYSYISLNNFQTNFSPVYTGDILFRHSLTSYAGPYDPIKSNNFGWAASNPLIPVMVNGPKSGELQSAFSFFETDNENIRLLTIKASEDGDGLIIRLAETAGKTSNAIIKVPFIKFKEVYQTNLAEENIKPSACPEDKIKVTLTPFEIITLRLRPGFHTPGKSKYFYSY